MMKKLALITVALLTMSGCTVRVADLTVGSTKNFDINSGNLVKGERVTGEDTYPVFFLPFGIPNVKTAIDRAIETETCAVGLSDVVISHLNHSFILGTTGFRVEGDLIIDKNRPGCEAKGV
jgi:CheY-specific phosphatase CheX